MNSDQKPISEINITPLTDVMLVLLIIFMISAPFIVPKGKEINIPKIQEFKTLKSENNLLVIGNDGSMILNGITVDNEQLKDTLQTIVDATDEPVNLFIRGDKLVPYGTIVSVMDVAQLSGVEKISLVSDVEEEKVKKTSDESNG
jgi:biopolymer transport protein ExbD